MSSKSLFWTGIVDEKSAKKVARQGIWASLLVGVPMAMYALYFKKYYSLIDVSLYFIIAFGIFKMSRVAAFSGFLLYLIEVIVTFRNGHSLRVLWIFAMFFLFLNGIRGTICYHKLIEKKGESIEKSLADYQEELEGRLNNPSEKF